MSRTEIYVEEAPAGESVEQLRNSRIEILVTQLFLEQAFDRYCYHRHRLRCRIRAAPTSADRQMLFDALQGLKAAHRILKDIHARMRHDICTFQMLCDRWY